MKVSFKEILEQTFEGKHGQWNYYSGQSFTEFPVTSERKSKEFIKSFFKLSGKGGPKLNEQIDKLGSRSIHVVSAFLLGHYLYENKFKKMIDNEIKKLKESLDLKSEVTFSFIWFLVCLFHDIGYNIEHNHLKYKSFDELKQNSVDMPGISGIPKFYNLIYKNYFEYRIKEHCKNDHGIMVGHTMYKELCEIRKLEENNPHKTNLCWEKNLEKIYAFCAWNVLGHNIWYGDKSDVTNYNKYKIEELLNNGDYKIKSKNHPFFFLFCLVDTIEPYKRILNFNMLEQVFMEIKDDKIIISTDLKCKCNKTIIEQAKSLNLWLTDTLKTGNSVKISLNN